MKRLLIIALLAIGLTACGAEDPDKKPAKKSADIVKDYVETVVTAPEKARGAGAMVEAQQNKAEEMMRELEE